jgi:hypothetical protein
VEELGRELKKAGDEFLDTNDDESRRNGAELALSTVN